MKREEGGREGGIKRGGSLAVYWPVDFFFVAKQLIGADGVVIVSWTMVWFDSPPDGTSLF